MALRIGTYFADGKIKSFEDGQFKIITGSYIGNGGIKSVTTEYLGKPFQPKYIEIIDVTSPWHRSIKIDVLPGENFMRSRVQGDSANTTMIYETSNGITITSTGFVVGSRPSINRDGSTFFYLAIG